MGYFLWQAVEVTVQHSTAVSIPSDQRMQPGPCNSADTWFVTKESADILKVLAIADLWDAVASPVRATRTFGIYSNSPRLFSQRQSLLSFRIVLPKPNAST